MEVNPYAPPQVDIVVPATNADEALRKKHIHRETLIRTFGLVYLAFATLTGLPVLFVLAMAAIETVSPARFPIRLSNFAVPLVILSISTVVSLLSGLGMLFLRRWGATTAIITSVLYLFAFPAGTVFGAFMLYLLFSEKTERIFSRDYPRIIAATSSVRYPWTAMIAPAIGFLAVGGWFVLMCRYYLAAE